MRGTTKIGATLLVVLLLASRAEADQLIEIARFLIGNFTTEWQARTKANAADMRTYTKRIWHTRTDGVWLYTEVKHAADSYPFRKRVVHLRRDENIVLMSEFVPKNPDVLVKEELNPILWCDTHITRVTLGMFKGAVRSGGCRDDHKGAAFVTRVIELDKWRVVRSHYGYDGKGEQIWASKFPEEHVRIEK